MHLAHLAGMRRDRQPMRRAQVGHLDIFADAAKPGHVGLDIMHGAGRRRRSGRHPRVELLAERNRDRGRRARAACEPTSSYQSGSSNQNRSSGARPQNRRQVGRSHRPLPSMASVTSGPIAFRTAASRSRSTSGSSLPTLTFSRRKPSSLHRSAALIDRADPSGSRASRHRCCRPPASPSMPRREAARAVRPPPWLEIPKRNVHRRERKLGDAGAADPLQSGMAGELRPEPGCSAASSPTSSGV